MISVFISKLAFEMLACVIISEDLPVPTGGIIKKADDRDILMKIKTLADHGYIAVDENDKIRLQEKAYSLMNPIVNAKFVAAIGFGYEESAYETVYYSDDALYTVVQNSINRPDMIKISGCDNSDFYDYIDELVNRLKPDIKNLETDESAHNLPWKIISEISSNRILLNANVSYKDNYECVYKVLITETDKGLAIVKARTDGEITDIKPYSPENFVDFISMIAKADKNKIEFNMI